MSSVRRLARLVVLLSLPLMTPGMGSGQQSDRPRARDLGIIVGVFEPGIENAITDVSGVHVGHTTVIEPPDIRTGVTAILPHNENPFLSRVPGAVYVGNGFGKLLGVTQIRELGEIESPILLTCTLCVWKVADAVVDWMLTQQGMEDVQSINPVVGETNDGGLNAIRSRPIRPEHVIAALEGATDGSVEEGAVGGGAGTVTFGWKGGIGTSSRVLPAGLGGYTVGVLVQTNFGGILQINGAPVGIELGRYSFSEQVARDLPLDPNDVQQGGSVMMVVATDAPVSDRNLERMALRAVMGLSRTGSYASNGSGDYVIAFSTAPGVRRSGDGDVSSLEDLANPSTSPLFQATIEATEEAIYNSILRAETVTSNGRTVEAIPIAETVEILERHGAIR